MQITRLELYQYQPLEFNDIELLVIDIENPIQNIIGTNGSGKTSLLKELNPKPAIRKNYRADGYKKIYIQYNNSEYILSSNFINHSSPHSFIKDQEELNSSGTTSVQEELISTHLGYTTQTFNICYGKQKLSNMAVGNRKNYLLTLHPSQMKLVLDKYKKVTSSIRACQDNLSMLHERKSVLESQLIDHNLKAQLQQEHDVLSQDLATIINYLNQLKVLQEDTVTKLNNLFINTTIPEIKNIKSRLKNYSTFTSIDRSLDLDQIIQTQATEISVIENNLNTIQIQIQQLNQEIEKYEDHIQKNDAKSALSDIDDKVKSIQDILLSLKSSTTQTPFEFYLLDTIPQQLNTLADILSVFIGYKKIIPSTKEINDLRTKVDDLNSKHHKTRYEYDILTTQYCEYEKQLNAKIVHDIPVSCNACVLYKNYYSSISSIQDKCKESSIKLDSLNLKLKRLTLLIDHYSSELNEYQFIYPQLQRLSDFFNEYKYFLPLLKDIDILKTLKINPTSILTRLNSHFELSLNTRDYNQKQEELNKLLKEQDSLKTPSEYSQNFLINIVNDKKDQVEKLKTTYLSLEKKKLISLSHIKLIKSYREELASLKTMQKDLVDIQTKELLTYDKQVITLYGQHLAKMKSDIITRLTEVDKILRDQDLIKARYEDEVMSNISIIKAKELEYRLIEKALSPVTGIPNKYMVQFLNDILIRANIFLNEICSYEFEFLLFEVDQPIDYYFKMRVKDKTISDISECSEGQEEMGNFVFNLSLAIQLNRSEYPFMMDEIGRTFDSQHKQKLVNFLKSLTEEKILPQLFIINHHATISSGLLNSDTIVLNTENIVVPEIYNEHVLIEKYK